MRFHHYSSTKVQYNHVWEQHLNYYRTDIWNMLLNDIKKPIQNIIKDM